MPHFSDFTRSSEKFALKYLDCVQFHIIDSMHNLFLGTAKYVFKLWADNIFTKKQLKEITKKIEELNTATSIGRIQRKLE